MSKLDNLIEEGPSQASTNKIINNLPIIIFTLGTLILIIVIYLFVKYKDIDEENVVIEIDNINYNNTKDIYIDISGAIKIPGVYKLKSGDRVQDAIIKSGNLLDNAHKEWIQKKLNLASTLSDGQKIYIPFESESILGLQNQTNANLININQATASELEKLPRIGPAIATKIVEYRQNNGNFNSIEDIKQVPGISESLYQDIASLISTD